MKLKLSEVLPNPYRDLKNNELDRNTVARLRESIGLTGFWDNVVVRKNKKGKYELAYGHHRLEAAKQEGIKEADFIVKKFSDADMIRVMKDDNDEAYAFKPLSLLESVRAVIKALSDKAIDEFKIDPKFPKTRLRFAPSFVPGKVSDPESGAHPYTPLAVALFLGDTRKNSTEASEAIQAAIGALQLIELGELTEKSIQNLPLDSPKTGSGLIQVVSTRLRNLEARQKQAVETQAQVNKVIEEQRKAEQTKKVEVAKLQKQREEAKAAQREAEKADRKREAEQFKKKQEELKEQEKEREQKYQEERPKFEAKIEVIKKAEQEAVVSKQRDLALRKRVDAFIFKLEAPLESHSNWDEEFQALHKQLPANANDARMRIRNAMESLSTWLDERSWSIMRPSKKQTGGDVLKEETQKEETKRKQGREAQD